MTQPEIALFLRKQRKARGLTMREVGEKTGMSGAHVGNAENPNDPTRFGAREKLLRFYGFSVETVYNVTPLT